MAQEKTQENISTLSSSVIKQIELQKDFIQDRQYDLEKALIEEAKIKNLVNEIKSDLDYSEKILSALNQELNEIIPYRIEKSSVVQKSNHLDHKSKRYNIDDKILTFLESQALTIPEISHALLLNYNIVITLVGLRGKFDRLEREGKITKINPESKRNVRYKLTTKEKNENLN
jgi:hypothetical protein